MFGTAALLLGTAIYLPVTLLAPLSPAKATVLAYEAPIDAPAALDWPSYGSGAIGALGFDGVLATHGSQKARPIASISKVITVLVVLQKKPLAAGDEGPRITFGPADVQIYNQYLAVNGLVKPVHAGLVLSERDVIELALLPSAANYATSLATWAYGSQSAFLTAANDWLDANGLTDTTFTEPTGLSAANTATVADLVALAKLALADPAVAEITQLKSDTIPSVGAIENTNRLLGVQGVHGIKTGSLLEAGACLLFAADYTVGDTTVTVVGAVLGGPGDDHHVTLDRDVRALLHDIKAGFHAVPVAKKGEAFARFETEWGESADAVAASSASILVWSDSAITALVETQKVTLAADQAVVGTVHFVAGTHAVDVQLILEDAVTDPGAMWRLTHPIELL